MKDELIKIIILALSEELIAQGHNNTGSLIKSFEGKLSPDNLGIDIWANSYAKQLDRGVRWEKKRKRPPVRPLIEYFKHKGVADPESAAYATIATWKKQGMPTRGSYRYSKNGKRKDFIEEAYKKNKDKIVAKQFSIEAKKMNDKINKIFKGLEAHGGGSGFGGGGVWVF